MTSVDSSGHEEEDDTDNNDTNNTTTTNAMAIVKEIEMERTHRRIATRGVVALFNAITKHRAAITANAAEKEEDKRRIREEGRLRGLAVLNEKKKLNGGGSVGSGSGVGGGLLLESTTTKHGFLDMIKMSASTTLGGGGGGGGDSGPLGNKNNSTSSVPVGSSGNKIGSGVKTSIGWTALKDDFMMNSKLKVRKKCNVHFHSLLSNFKDGYIIKFLFAFLCNIIILTLPFKSRTGIRKCPMMMKTMPHP
jgi:hypothetical protein